MSETIFKKVDYNLGGLVEDIAHGSIGLPDIQRPFVWPNAKIRDLFDSMYKGYPVGYLLFWENGLVPGHKTIGSDTKQLQPNLVIVDGQQRLTSLYAVMKGVPILRSNYQSERIRIAFNPMDEVFEVTSAAIQRDRSFMPDISRLWSNETNLFQVVDQYMDGLRSVRKVSNDEIKSIQNSIEKLRALSSFPFTVLQLSADISEEDIGDVFVRINSQGKTLNQADFILTLMSVFWDEGRTDLERFCREARIPSTDAPSPYNHFIEPSPRSNVAWSAWDSRSSVRGSVTSNSILRGKDLESEEFSEERREEQFETLKKAQSKTLNVQYWHDFMQCIRQAGYRTRRMISSHNALLFAYMFYLIGKTEFHVDEHTLRSAIAQWFFMSAITGRYSGSPESTLESDLAMLRDVTTSEDFISKLQHVSNISLTTDFWRVTLPNELATSSARSPSLFAFEAALVLLDAPVLFSSFKIAEMMDPTLQAGHKPIERHHLFPRGYLETLGISQTRDRNQIANYAYVEWLDNVKISDQPPAEYLLRVKERFTPGELARMYRLHALPNDWEHMDYWTFLEHRRELMAQIIREGYEKLIVGAEVPTESGEIVLTDLIGGGESDAVEFKSTLRTNLHTDQRDNRMEHAVLKTLAGFLNSDGGTVVHWGIRRWDTAWYRS